MVIIINLKPYYVVLTKFVILINKLFSVCRFCPSRSDATAVGPSGRYAPTRLRLRFRAKSRFKKKKAPGPPGGLRLDIML